MLVGFLRLRANRIQGRALGGCRLLAVGLVLGGGCGGGIALIGQPLVVGVLLGLLGRLLAGIVDARGDGAAKRRQAGDARGCGCCRPANGGGGSCEGSGTQKDRTSHQLLRTPRDWLALATDPPDVWLELFWP